MKGLCKRLLTALVGSLLCCLGLAQEHTVPIDLADGGNSVQGAWTVINMTLGGSGQMPLVVEFTATITSGHLWEVDVVQTHKYVAGQYVAITERPATGGGAVSGAGASYEDLDILTDFFSYISSHTDDTHKTGKYQARVKIKTTGGTVLATSSLLFSIIDFEAAAGRYTPSGGGGGANSPDPEEQEGFWSGLFSDLFIPDEQCMTDIREAAEQYTEWGPLGLFNQMLELLEAEETQMQYTTTAVVNLNNGITANMNVDVGWADTMFKLIRLLFAGAIWSGAILMSWKLAQKFMVS